MNKEQILAELKATKERIEFLESELNKPDKFEFNYDYGIAYKIHADKIDMNSILTRTEKEKFRYRRTEENAQADFQLQKELMCIGAIADQLAPDYKSKLFSNGRANYLIRYNHVAKCYEADYDSSISIPGVVYMPRNIAEKVCEILNKGEVEL